MLDARRIAHRVLVRVDKGGAFANRALDSALAEAGRLDPRDVALATEIAYGTLRRQVFIDHALAHFSKQPLAELDAETRALLRLGAHQLLHMRVPERAAVHTTVELSKEVRGGRAQTFVNAVLRTLARERANILVPPASVDPAGNLSLTESFPRWLCEELLGQLGFDEAKAYLAAMNLPAPFTLRVNERRGDRPAVERELKGELGLDALPTRYSPVGLTIEEAKSPAALLRPEEGRWQAQDEAAQLVGFFCAPQKDARVLDACAAPGGKTCHLGELMDDTGSIDAVDVHPTKIQEVADAARKLGLTRITPHAHDATLPLPFAPPEGYDLILCDAPCSGLGTLRRHPELKLRRGPEDVQRLAELQAKILDNLVHHLKPGGVLVYSVCTFTRTEGSEQVERFLARHPDFRRDAAPAGRVQWEGLLDGRGDLVLDPHHQGVDAFFAARLVRRS